MGSGVAFSSSRMLELINVCMGIKQFLALAPLEDSHEEYLS